MDNVFAQRVRALRSLMAENGWDAVVIPASDPHGSEYPAPRWKQVEWVSGFTGEAGDLVVTMTHAGLWTDSRYFIQAVNQLAGSGIELHKTRVPEAVGIPEWLVSEGLENIVVDGLCCSLDFIAGIREVWKAAGREPCALNILDIPDLLDRIWEDRPSVPSTPVTTLDEQDVGESRMHKIVWLRKFLMSKGCDSILISSLDEIAWLLNVRGSDIEYNPLIVSYLFVSMDDICWYVKKGGQETDVETEDSFAELVADGVTLADYEGLALSIAGMDDGSSVFVDGTALNYNIYKHLISALGPTGVICGDSPVQLRKAVKNTVEIENIREAFIEDGVAVEKFLYWLETLLGEGRMVTEWEASRKLTSLRSEIPGYRGNSFENISAYGANAALPHYSTPVTGSAFIRPEGLYLTDSGGQYLFGTTDITRTIPVGECSSLEKEDYTLVLKGMIQLSMAVFPRGTAGCHLDVLARNSLWRSKRNFGHGTGHGLGFYLCVHEGPQSIRQNLNAQPLLPGMVTSNEPGIYREGRFGIRHENIVLCKEAGVNDFGDWLCFETLTCCHIDTSVIVKELMTSDEIDWLNAYNASVYEKLSGKLPADVALWLKEKTAAI